jgi:hypothetical protein
MCEKIAAGRLARDMDVREGATAVEAGKAVGGLRVIGSGFRARMRSIDGKAGKQGAVQNAFEGGLHFRGP